MASIDIPAPIAGSSLQAASQLDPVKQVGGAGLPPIGRPNPLWAAIFLGAALVVMFGTAAWFSLTRWLPPPTFSGGDAAVAVGILLFIALLLNDPTLIMDDAPEAGGEPSTMRIMGLAIVLTFCLIMLRTGFNTGALPSLENQGNWVWLVTAAIGGKAVQKYAEIRDSNNSTGK